MFDFLCSTDQSCIINEALFDLANLFFGLLDQSLHRHAFNTLKLEARRFHSLIDPLNLPVRLFQVGSNAALRSGLVDARACFFRAFVNCFSALYISESACTNRSFRVLAGMCVSVLGEGNLYRLIRDAVLVRSLVGHFRDVP